MFKHPVFVISDLLPPVFINGADFFNSVIVIFLLAVFAVVADTVKKNFYNFPVLENYVGDIKPPYFAVRCACLYHVAVIFCAAVHCVFDGLR